MARSRRGSRPSGRSSRRSRRRRSLTYSGSYSSSLASSSGSSGSRSRQSRSRSRSNNSRRSARSTASSSLAYSRSSAGSSTSGSSGSGSSSGGLGAIQEFEPDCAVLVTDMSGFTRITRKMGIVHYASLIVTMRHILYPLFKRYGALSIETEADNFFVVFPDAQAAVKSAMTAMEHLRQYNETARNDDFKIVIGGLGVATGSRIIQDERSGKLYGVSADVAFHLGEDTADKGEILTDTNTWAILKNDAAFADVRGKRRVDPEKGIKHYILSGSLHATDQVRLTANDMLDDSYARSTKNPAFMAKLASRNVLRDTDDFDAEVHDQYMGTKSVVMYGLDTPTTTAKYGIERAIAVRQKAVELTAPVVARYDGVAVEDTFFIFDNEWSALAAVMSIKQIFADYNEKASEKNHVLATGYGIHTGSLFVVKDTNIHWGDPVNTASKLGEDLAVDGQVIITSAIKEAVEGEPACSNVEYEEGTTIMSKVELLYYVVTGEFDADSPRIGRSKGGRSSRGGRRSSRGRRAGGSRRRNRSRSESYSAAESSSDDSRRGSRRARSQAPRRRSSRRGGGGARKRGRSAPAPRRRRGGRSGAGRSFGRSGSTRGRYNTAFY